MSGIEPFRGEVMQVFRTVLDTKFKKNVIPLSCAMTRIAGFL